MGKIKNLKLIDLVVQVLAIALPWVYYLLFPDGLRYWHLEHIITSYSVVFAVLAGSGLFNRSYLPSQIRAKSRHWFESVFLMLIAMELIATVMKALMLFLMIALIVVPIITFWYIGITVAEMIKLTKVDSGIESGV